MSKNSNAEEKSRILQNPPPRPIAQRVCACDCGNTFQPRRVDKIYLNKQHADFGYNHGKRKENQGNQILVEKNLRLNDKVLKKHFDSSSEKEVTCYLEILKTDGLNLSFLLGQSTIGEKIYYHTYNYRFHLFEEDGFKKVKIRKL